MSDEQADQAAALPKKRSARRADSVRHARAGARPPAAEVHGREVRPGFDLGKPSGPADPVTDVELEALLEEQTVPLGEAMCLAVASTLPLNVGPDALVTLRCGHVPLLRGRVGRTGEHIAIRIEGPPDDEEQR